MDKPGKLSKAEREMIVVATSNLEPIASIAWWRMGDFAHSRQRPADCRPSSDQLPQADISERQKPC